MNLKTPEKNAKKIFYNVKTTKHLVHNFHAPNAKIFNEDFILPKIMWTFSCEDLVNFQPCLFLKWTFFAIPQGEKLVVIRLQHTWSSFK